MSCSSDIGKSSGSDIHEKGFQQDIVSLTAPSSLPLSYATRRIPRPGRCTSLDRIFWKPLPMPKR